MAVFAGTHGVANGLDAVIAAAAVLKRRGRNDIQLVLIGRGKCKPALVKEAARLELENVVFQEPVCKAQLAGLLSAADLGLQILADVPAFYFGTSPNKFFDYIAAGLPVLNNYPGWLATLIEGHGCGFTVPPGDPERFADALERAADDRPRLLEMGIQARKLAHAEFDRSLLADRLADWLERTLAQRCARTSTNPAG